MVSINCDIHSQFTTSTGCSCGTLEFAQLQITAAYHKKHHMSYDIVAEAVPIVHHQAIEIVYNCDLCGA